MHGPLPFRPRVRDRHLAISNLTAPMDRRWRTFLQFLAVAAVFLLVVRDCFSDPAATVATFNIENFPKSDRQIDGAFETLRGLDAEIVGLQEIGSPDRFRREAKSRLGDTWDTIWADMDLDHRIGLLVDRAAYRLEEHETHRETVVCRGCKPVLEARLSPLAEGRPPLAVYVLHLKAHDDGLEIRRRQYRALRAILRASDGDGARRVVLGDFNSTEEADRELLDGFADAADLRWTTRRIECTGYWKPDDRCRGTILDHVLADGAAPAAVGRGPCASSCEPGASCPTYVDRVSDHCPVTLSLPPAN